MPPAFSTGFATRLGVVLNPIEGTLTGQCPHHLFGCVCGLQVHDESVAHECATEDPQCGGSWISKVEHPTLAWVVRWPGIRPGGPNQYVPIDDPPDGEPVETTTC